MSPIELLKEQLQTALKASVEGLDFNMALDDAIYSCQFESETALVQWMNSWVSDDLTFKFDLDYQRGVQFVEQQWHKITGMF